MVSRFILFPDLPLPAGKGVELKKWHEKQLNVWAAKLSMASRAASNLQRSANIPATSRARELAAVSFTKDDCYGSWLAGMVRTNYGESSWPFLEALLSGEKGQSWVALLRSLEKLLCFDYKQRATAKGFSTS